MITTPTLQQNKRPSYTGQRKLAFENSVDRVGQQEQKGVYLVIEDITFRRHVKKMLEEALPEDFSLVVGQYTETQLLDSAVAIVSAAERFERKMPDSRVKGPAVQHSAKPLPIIVLDNKIGLGSIKKHYVNAAYRGACDYITIPSISSIKIKRLISSIKAVTSGECPITDYFLSYLKKEPGDVCVSGEVLANVIERSVLKPPKFQLTKNELRLLELACKGKQNSEIARQMCKSEQTVKNDFTKLYNKMGVKNRAQATYMALQKGLIN